MTYQTLINRFFIAVFLFLSVLLLGSCTISATGPSKLLGIPADLPLPSSLPLVDYEKKLYRWTINRQYRRLGWAVDKGVRDTGPFIDGIYYGTHPAVRIFYSPEVMTWLENGRPEDQPIADGGMIIKEMFAPPAALYQELAKDPKYQNLEDYDKLLSSLVGDWTIMVKDSKGSSDGWFWGSVSLPTEDQTIDAAIAAQVDTVANRGNAALRWSGFGMPCIRCHASAEQDLTFSDLANIKGYPGEPLIFQSDSSWRIASHFETYPLRKIKDEPYVKDFFNLPKQQLSWGSQQSLLKKPEPKAVVLSDHDLSDNLAMTIPSVPVTKANPEFLSTFAEIPPVAKTSVAAFPPEWQDHVVMPANHPKEYVTADNCLGCHGGLGGKPYTLTMFLQNGPKYGDGFNISEYGEWRWSPMGLAGRDPIFHAQLESEMNILANDEAKHKQQLKGTLKDTRQAVTNTCLSCHGAMGQRQLKADAKNNSQLDANFNVDYFYLSEVLTEQDVQQQKKQDASAYDKYGALAREGISCMVCHHIDAPDPQKVEDWLSTTVPGWITKNTPKELAYNLFHQSTGHYNPGSADEIFGPFDVTQKPMEHALGTTPQENHYTSDSQMCGNCHTINLPNIGATDDKFPVLTATAAGTAFADYSHTMEQATFLEWQNSIFAAVDSKDKPTAEFKSCQDCHMPGGFKNVAANIEIDQLVTQIASIQDSSYPSVGNELPTEEIDIPLRNDYKRHTNVGLNVFLLSMFDQFNDILGISKTDYMTSTSNGVDLSLDSMIQQAQEATVDMDVEIQSVENNVLMANVRVSNKTGHRMPSGVAFRRAFIEFTVMDGDQPIWRSGSTNSVGVILGANKQPLKTEFLPDQYSYQPHYSTINSQDQVQIYEELTLNAQNEFTTSFVHRVKGIKDNRLLPRGWRPSSYFKDQGEVIYQFMEATDPEGRASSDPDYINETNSLDFAGQDSLTYVATLKAGTNTDNLWVKATLYNQSIPPYWLKQRFTWAPEGKATQRLHYMASHLDLSGTEMENWKLRLASDTDKWE